MSTIFISRHPGAVEWMKNQPIRVDRWMTHLIPEDVHAGDIVIGTLPIHLAFEVCRRGARYIALEITMPEEKRGKELPADELRTLSCKLEEFIISKPNPSYDSPALFGRL